MGSMTNAGVSVMRTNREDICCGFWLSKWAGVPGFEVIIVGQCFFRGTALSTSNNAVWRVVIKLRTPSELAARIANSLEHPVHGRC